MVCFVPSIWCKLSIQVYSDEQIIVNIFKEILMENFINHIKNLVHLKKILISNVQKIVYINIPLK